MWDRIGEDSGMWLLGAAGETRRLHRLSGEGGGLESFVWLPDIHIWHGTRVTRWRGTTPLNDITYRSEPGCPSEISEITLEFDGRFAVK